MTLFSLVILTLLVAINALYVAAEFAAVSVSRARIQQFAEEGSKTAERLLPILQDPHSLDQYVAACQIGITFSSLLLGAYGQVKLSLLVLPLLTSSFGLEETTAIGITAGIVLVGLTAFQMILGELLPKSLALQFPTKVALATLGPMIVSLRAFYPFIVMLNGSGAFLLKVFGVPQTSHRHVHSAEEMGLLFSESREGGHIASEEHERLEQALQLRNRKVAEIMIPRNQIKALEISADYEAVLDSMANHPFTRWPVYAETLDNIVGIVHTRDVAKLALDTSKAFKLSKVIRNPLVVHEGMAADDLLAVMRTEHKQLAIVVDEYGMTVGLAGISDVFDELMGDIHDSPEMEGEGVQRLSNGQIRLPGSLRLSEAGHWLGREWESEHAITVAGKILEALGTIPSPGDSFEIDGIQGVVERVHRRAIASVVIRPLPPKEEGGADE